LEMLHKGGQRAVDEFTASGLHGLEKRKANALQKAKRANPNDGGDGGSNGNQARRRARPCRWGFFWEPGTIIYADPRPGFQRSTPAAAAAPGAQMWERPQIGPQDGRLPLRLATAVTRSYQKIYNLDECFWNKLFYISM
jgi:hypothetical protein